MKKNSEMTLEEMMNSGKCPSEYGYDEEDCWNDNCKTCWEKIIKREKAIDTLMKNKL